MRIPITSADTVYIRGKHLYIGDEDQRQRFFMKGIAFPIPPPSQTRHYYYSDNDTITAEDLSDESYLSGWIKVLEQLANDSDVNTIRLYEMDCRFNYSSFLNRAAELGMYLMIPLTTISGPGVLSRIDIAPRCYSKELFEYGAMCLDRFWDYPNVIAGVVGNEVMNNLKAWGAAPCVKAYLDDLARYSLHKSRNRHISENDKARRSLPLLYTAQHDSPSAEQSPDEAIKLTFDYLSCRSKNSGYLEGVVFFGINIESWCSSLQSFEYEENGFDESSYHSVWRTLFKGTKLESTMDAVTGEITWQELPTISPEPLHTPIIFSEMGCSKYLFNRDNGLQQTRDWKQIQVVLEHPMSDDLSGFIAYGYDGGGNAAFRMMGDDNIKWDGDTPLPPSQDYINFCDMLSSAVIETNPQYEILGNSEVSAISCEEISNKLENLWGVSLYSLEEMPSYFSPEKSQPLKISTMQDAGVLRLPEEQVAMSLLHFSLLSIIAAFAALIAVGLKFRRINRHKDKVFSECIINYGSCNNR